MVSGLRLEVLPWPAAPIRLAVARAFALDRVCVGPRDDGLESLGELAPARAEAQGEEFTVDLAQGGDQPVGRAGRALDLLSPIAFRLVCCGTMSCQRCLEQPTSFLTGNT